MDSMGVQTQADSEDDFYGTYEEILTENELHQLENEFRPRLKNACFLDHAGATLYGKSQIDGVSSELQSSLFSNPHSRNPSSSITTDAIDYIRLRILHHFGTTGEDYSVIFTSGATSALKLVAESFRFNGGTFAYMEESHTSVVGMREVVGVIKPVPVPGPAPTPAMVDDQIKENKNVPVGPVRGVLGIEDGEKEKVASDSTPKVYCLAKATLEKLMDSKCGGCFACTRNRNSKPPYHCRYREGLGTLISYDQDDQDPDPAQDQEQDQADRRGNHYQAKQPEHESRSRPNGLLAYPAQCNFSGYKYPLEWIEKAQKNHLDDINQIDQFYIEPQHIVHLRCQSRSRSRSRSLSGDEDKMKTKQDQDTDSQVETSRGRPQPGKRVGGEEAVNIKKEMKLKEMQFELNSESTTDTATDADDPGQELELSSKLLHVQHGQKLHSMDRHESTRIKNEYNRNGMATMSQSASNKTSSGQRASMTTSKCESSISPSLGGRSGAGMGTAKADEPTLSNNCGVRRDDDETEETEMKSPFSWYVLLDAASYVATNALDLSLYPADFVVCSFYKMFGFPTGLGALIVRNEAGGLLEKRYFGGGTVNIAIPSQSFHAKRARLHEKFEDGTISFLSILALRHGFDALNRLGRSIDTISTRVFRLAQYCYKNLAHMKYPNGQPVAVIYSDTKYESRSTQGPIVTFNLLRPDGTIIGYSEMEQIAYLHDVHLRYGCFCNVGACRRHLKLDPDELLKHYEAGHVCGDMNDLMDGKPTGAIRVSFGYMTTQKDVDIILRMIHTCWVQPFQSIREKDPVELFPKHEEVNKIGDDDNPWRPKGTTGASHLGKGSPRKLSRIFVYPVKSCAPFQVSKMWAIGNRGLLYDREWLIMNSSGVPLTQKREPRLCQLKPNIDISNRRLVLSMEGYPDVSVPLEIKQVEREFLDGKKNTFRADLCTSKVCGDAVSTLDCGEEVNNWLSTVLNRPGLKLARMTPEQLRKPRNAMDEISLANFSQFLLLSMGSLRRLARDLLDKKVDWAGLESDLNLDSPSYKSTPLTRTMKPAECKNTVPWSVTQDPEKEDEDDEDPDPVPVPDKDPCEQNQVREGVEEVGTGRGGRNDERAQRENGSDTHCTYTSDQNHDLLDQQLCRTSPSSNAQSKGKEQEQVWEMKMKTEGYDLNDISVGIGSPPTFTGNCDGVGVGGGHDGDEGDDTSQPQSVRLDPCEALSCDKIRSWDSNSRNGFEFTSKVHQNETTTTTKEKKNKSEEKEHLRITKIVEELIERFRANLVITDENERENDDGGCSSWSSSQSERSRGGSNYSVRECFPLHPYEEESWDEIRIGTIPLKSGGPCLRCATICTDQKTGQRSAEPFLTLSASRQGQANFGIHLYGKRTGEEEPLPHEMKQSSLSKNIGNGHGRRDKETVVSWSKNESEELQKMFSLSSSVHGPGPDHDGSASSPSSLALWTSSSSSSSSPLSSSSRVTSAPPLEVKIIRVGDLLHIDSLRPEPEPKKRRTDSNGNEVGVVTEDEVKTARGRVLAPGEATAKSKSVRVVQKNHYHLSANVPHRNANGNPSSATLENKKIIDSID